MTAILISLLLNSCAEAETSKSSQEDKKEVLYIMPSESSPHEGTWLQWPQEYQYGKTYRDRIEGTWVAMAREIVSGEQLHIIAYNTQAKERIIRLLTDAKIPLANIDFWQLYTHLHK